MSNANQNYNQGGAKGFFIKHGEKIGLGVAALIVLLLFKMGTGVESITEQETPQRLQSLVQQAEAHINSSTWALIEKDRTPNYELTATVVEGRKDVKPEDYPLTKWRESGGSLDQRKDPKIYEPTKPEVEALATILAIRGGRRGKIDDLPPAEVDPVEEKKGPRPRPRPRPPMGGDADIFGGVPMPMGGIEPGVPEPAGGMMPGMAGEGTGAFKKLGPHLRSVITQDWHPSSGTAGSAVGRSIVVIKSLVPIEKQWQEFERELHDGVMGFDEVRDRPRYYKAEVQVADVTDDPDTPEADLKWKSFANLKSIHDGEPLISDTDNQIGKIFPLYAGMYPERVDMDYYDKALTMPIPTMVMQPNVSQFVRHSETPEPKLEKGDAKTPVDGGRTFEDRLKDPTGGGPRTPGAAYPDFGDSTMPMPEGMVDPSGMSSTGVDGPKVEPPAVPNKLLRFFDLMAEPEHKYRYRVRVLVYDPNSPNQPTGSASSMSEMSGVPAPSGSTQPFGQTGSARGKLSASMLHPQVVVRLQNQKNKNAFWRASPWSEISEVVTVPTMEDHVYAGSATAARPTSIGDFQFVRDEPSGKVVASVWDPSYIAHVPAEQEVGLGSVLNFEKRADVLHPIDLTIRKIEKYDFETDQVVLDIRGGETLPGGDRYDPLRSPGEFLVMDKDGNLTARHEFDDMDIYRQRLFLEDSAQNMAAASDGMDMPSPMGDGLFDGFVPTPR